MTDNPTPMVLADVLRAGHHAVNSEPPPGTPSISETSIDSTLLLARVGLEPADFVFGVGSFTFPYRQWSGLKHGAKITTAGQVVDAAMASAATAVKTQATEAGALGVVGLKINVTIKVHYVTVEMKGTAVRSSRPSRVGGGNPYVTALSARDLVVLDQSGWTPVDIVFGSAFAIARYQQQPGFTNNAELTTLTEALYQAREQAVAKLQRRGVSLGATGVVGVATDDEAHWLPNLRVVAFRTTGTAVQRTLGHRTPMEPPTLSVELSGAAGVFEPAALRGSLPHLLAYRDGAGDRAFSDSVTDRARNAFNRGR